MKKLVNVFLIAGILVVSGCKKKSTEPGDVGSIEGYVTTLNGVFPLGGVEIYIKENSDKKTYTNNEGYFILKSIPSGEKTLVAKTGSHLYESKVEVEPGKTKTVFSKNNPLKIGQQIKIAVVKGVYDYIEAILDTIGFSESSMPEPGKYVMFDSVGEFLSSQYLNDFDIVFFNCGLYDESTFWNSSQMQQELRNWIESGKSMYASDWAYVVVERTFPTVIDFYGDDSYYGNAEVGEAGSVKGIIKSSILEKHLGKSEIDIVFDLGGWVVVQGPEPGANVEIWIEADTVKLYSETLVNVPIMLYFKAGQGSVMFTSFHNEAQATEDMIKTLVRVIYSL